MLTLERIGVRRPATYAALSRHAQRLTRLASGAGTSRAGTISGRRRAHRADGDGGTLDLAAAERLLDALALTPIDTRRGYMGAIAVFLARHVGPAIGAGPDVPFEEALIQALAGPRVATRAWRRFLGKDRPTCSISSGARPCGCAASASAGGPRRSTPHLQSSARPRRLRRHGAGSPRHRRHGRRAAHERCHNCRTRRRPFSS